MPNVLILLLLAFWLYLAYHALQRGAAGLAAVYLVVGVALTAWRLGRARG